MQTQRKTLFRMSSNLSRDRMSSSTPKSIPDIYTLWGIAFARVFGYSDWEPICIFISRLLTFLCEASLVGLAKEDDAERKYS